MTVNEILRHLLDERGVKWDYGITGATTTRFNVNGVDLTFMPMRDGLICTTILTPEQAIAATLETETCRFGKSARQNGKRLPCERLMDENAKLQQELTIRKESKQEKVIEYLRQEIVDWEDKYRTIVAENVKLRELALGLKWCSKNYGCENLCPLYDKSEPEHCREEQLLRELEVEVD